MCGTGNLAESYDDLGSAQAIDACCRAHDFCNLTIEPGHCSLIDEKHEQCNSMSYTMSHCSCDSDFKNCLDNIDTILAKARGIVIKGIFFGALKTQCFNGTRMSPQWKRVRNLVSCGVFEGTYPTAAAARTVDYLRSSASGGNRSTTT
ncbi:phospholipase A2 large subunit-like [Temnothorax nylanderi]|uniref:phospholipase A2 large subunit-like n=1 Tax=Temnothorax nylanderi TaxID=102681 RepID=UPI003A8A1D4A